MPPKFHEYCVPPAHDPTVRSGTWLLPVMKPPCTLVSALGMHSVNVLVTGAPLKLSRLSVYIMLSTIFVLLVGLTVALIVFTPLKYYIPGASTDYKSALELRNMKYQVYDANKQLRLLEQYDAGLRSGPLRGGDKTLVLDTNRLNVPKPELTDD